MVKMYIENNSIKNVQKIWTNFSLKKTTEMVPYLLLHSNVDTPGCLKKNASINSQYPWVGNLSKV